MQNVQILIDALTEIANGPSGWGEDSIEMKRTAKEALEEYNKSESEKIKPGQENLLQLVQDWAKDRKSSMFCIPCDDKKQALEVQGKLKTVGFRGFITQWSNGPVEVILYLNDIKY